MNNVKISPSHRRFVSEFLLDLNGAKAWIRSGHDVPETTARNNAARVLTNSKIKVATLSPKVLKNAEVKSVNIC